MNRSIFIAIIFLLGSCSGRQDHRADKIEIDLSVSVDNIETRTMNLSVIASEFKTVFLESSEAALLNKPTEFAINDEYILIVDRDQNPAKLFTTAGKYLRNIGSIGVGPDEYLSVVSPHLDKKDNSIWLLLGGNYSHPKEGWIYIYNESGHMVNRINTRDRARDRNSNRVLIHNNKVIRPGNVDSGNMIEIKSVDDEKTVKIKNRIPSDYFTYTTNTSIVYPFEGNYHFKIGESDTIYSLSADGDVSAIATVFTEAHKFDEEKVREARSSGGPGRFENIQTSVEGCYSITLLGETAEYYLLSIRINGKANSTKLLAVDKDSGEAFFFEIINDFRFDIASDRQPFIYNNEYIIFHYPAITFIDALRKKIEDTEDINVINDMEMLAECIKPGDNDILLIYRMKL